MRIKIFTVHHFVPQQYVANEIFMPFVTGQKIGPHEAIISDVKGNNIAGENSHAEMRAHYYVWKNLLADCDYVGFQHYRRLFFFDQMPSKADDPSCRVLRDHFSKEAKTVFIDLDAKSFAGYQRILQNCNAEDIAAIKDFIGRYDIITVRPINSSLADEYRRRHVAADWDALTRLLPRGYECDPQRLYTCNMFIMRAAEFDAYMKFWQKFMNEFTKKVKPHADPQQSRVYGFISERLFSIYLHQRRKEEPGLRYAEMPGLMSSAVQV